MEIEFNKKTMGFQICSCDIPDMKKCYETLLAENELFNLEEQIPGLHDLDLFGDVIHGYSSTFKPYEADTIEKGLPTKKLLTKNRNSRVLFN
jgi:hypothetical protein